MQLVYMFVALISLLFSHSRHNSRLYIHVPNGGVMWCVCVRRCSITINTVIIGILTKVIKQIVLPDHIMRGDAEVA